MTLTREEVRKIAELARIELTAAEEKRHAETISAVLEYMKILNEVDTSKVEPTAQVTGLQNVTRADAVKESHVKKELSAQWPQVKMGELVVPGVFNEE